MPALPVKGVQTISLSERAVKIVMAVPSQDGVITRYVATYIFIPL